MSEQRVTAQPGAASTTHHAAVAALPAPEAHAALPAPGQTSGSKPSGNAGGTIRKLLVLLIILAAVGGAIWKIRKNRAETAAQPVGGRPPGGGGPTPVLVTPVVQRTVPVYLTALGTVTAYNSVTIKSRVDGQLLSVNVREGQTVRKGQLLAEIDARPYQAVVAQAEGALARDQAASANATAQAGRYTALYGAGVISKESEQAQISSAGQASGVIQADQAAIQAAKVNVAYTRITSPIDGTVGLRTVDPGNIVHASDATGLILITQVHPIAVIFTLPEDQLPQVLKLTRGGAKLMVEAYDRSETQHLATGTLLTVDNQIDTTTGTAKIKAVFPNTDNALFPNQFINVRLVLEQRQNALVVPSAALQTATTGNFVYVVRQGDAPAGMAGENGGGQGGRAGGRRAGGGAGASPAAAPGTGAESNAPGGEGARPAGPHYYVEAVPVKIDLTQGSNTVLGAGGVKAGDELVIDGQEKLKNGARVVPKQTDAPGGRAAGNGATAPAGRGGRGPVQTGDATGPQGSPRAGDAAQGTSGRQP